MYYLGAAVTCFSHPSVHKPINEAEELTKKELEKWNEEMDV